MDEWKILWPILHQSFNMLDFHFFAPIFGQTQYRVEVNCQYVIPDDAVDHFRSFFIICNCDCA
jgi:hypothetical protein